MKINISVICILLIFIGTQVFAQEDMDEEMFATSFLFTANDVTVVGVSKKVESIQRAPGIVSVITAKDIKDLAAQTITEAIGFTTGVLVNDSYFTEYNNITIRGHKSEYNNKVLLLINGHPSYSSIHGGFDANSIPIEAVERIEIIRGPSSILYGTNALTGVINIITKKEIKDGNGMISYQYGSFQSHELRAVASQKVDDFSYLCALTIKEQDGYDLDIRADQDESGAAWTHEQYDNTNAVFLNLKYKELELDLNYNDRDKTSKQGLLPNYMFRNDAFDDLSYYADLRYKVNISDNSSVNFKLRYEYDEFEYIFTNARLIETLVAGFAVSLPNPAVTGDSEKYGAEINFDLNPSEEFNISTGILYDDYTIGPYSQETQPGLSSPLTPWTDDRENSDIAVYANLNWNVTEALSLVGGARYSDNDVSGSHTDYRAGTVYAFTDNWVMKVLWATSYRSPTTFELFVSTPPIIVGDENLDFETMEGVDIELFYKSSDNRLNITATYYYNKLEDLIERVLVPAKRSVAYVNSEGAELSGIELDIKYALTEKIKVFMNGYHVLDSENLETSDELTDITEDGFNIGIAANITDKLRIVNANLWRGDHDEADSYFVSNLGLYLDVSESVSLSLIGNNIFDEEYDYEASSRDGIVTSPGGAPSAVWAGVEVKF